jgi:hypothetical protein
VGVNLRRFAPAADNRSLSTTDTLVLAELADGTAPSTVARKVGVGYATVARIAEKTKPALSDDQIRTRGRVETAE